MELYEEEAEVETDEEVEETVEREVMKDVVQEIKVPQVKALHPFAGQGLKITKGEVRRGENEVWEGGVATVLVPRRLYKMLAIKFAAKFASFATLIHRSCSSVQHFCRLLVFIALRL